MALRVVFLHGIMQNEEIITSHTLRFKELLTDCLNITYINAPHVLKSRPVLFVKECEGKTDDQIRVIEERIREEYYSKFGKRESYGRTWYFTDEHGKFSSNLRDVSVIGLEETLDLVLQECKRIDAHGILSFSQGTIIASLLLKRIESNSSIDWRPRFSILFSGPMPMSLPLYNTLTSAPPISFPSLHILGKSDDWVPNFRSLELSKCYEDPIIHYHTKGHIVPHEECLEVYQSFLSKFIDK